MRGNWMGIDTLGPSEDHPEDHIPFDSPRLHHNRNTHAEVRSDQGRAKLVDRLVLRPDGHVVTLSAHMPMKPGWVVVDPTGIDRPQDIGDGQTMTEREHIEMQNQARNLRRADIHVEQRHDTFAEHADRVQRPREKIADLAKSLKGTP